MGRREDLADELDRVANKLTRWRKFFAGWQLGTRADNDGESRALRHHLELSILLRSEVNALAGLLIRKGVFTDEEWTEQLIAEARHLDHVYEEEYPGWRTTEAGLSMKMPEAMETMKRLGFPP